MLKLIDFNWKDPTKAKISLNKKGIYFIEGVNEKKANNRKTNQFAAAR